MALRLARKLRREEAGWVRSDVGRLTEVAERHFALPSYELKFWERSTAHRPWQKAPGEGTA
jgi:hypothetical protein